MTLRKHLPVLMLFSAALFPLVAQALPAYSVTVLPTGFFAQDINNVGQIVGSLYLGNSISHAARYVDGSVTELGTGARDYSHARVINETGNIAALLVTSTDEVHGVVYSNGAMADLGNGTDAHGMNASGDVVGTITRPGSAEAFLYHGGALSVLENFGMPGYNVAWDINDAGTIVGEANIGNGPYAARAVMYENGTARDLGVLFGGSGSAAYEINNTDQVAGTSEIANGRPHAFFYDQGVMIDAGSFGGNMIEVNDMNERGMFVGTSTASTIPGTLGYIYRNGTLVDLGTLIDPALGWLIEGASGINDLGQVVVNACRAGGIDCVSLRLDPTSPVPEPGAAWMLIPGLLLLSRAAWRNIRAHAHPLPRQGAPPGTARREGGQASILC